MPLIVLGSANRDYTVLVDRHPLPGETVLGGSLTVATGGKGANQAAAGARSGARTVFVGAVGEDSVGSDILTELVARGVDVSNVARVDAPSGVALITVSRDGENSIVVAAGANSEIDPDSAATTVADLSTAGSVLLCQLEIPLEVVVAGSRAAHRAGARVVLNLSPSRTVPAELLALADPLIVNESEAADVAGFAIDGVRDAETAALALLASARSAVITLGGDGVVVADQDGVTHLESERVTVVDTTGAGDAFAGALAAALVAGATLTDAARAGIHAGAAAVQHLGAQPPL